MLRFHTGPLRTPGDPTVSAEDREFIQRFCGVHEVPEGEVRSVPLLDRSGEGVAVLLVVPMDRVRSLVRASPLYLRTERPVFERDGAGWPAAATVRVFKENSPRPVTRTAFWQERIPVGASREEVELWSKEPDRLLSEVAESLALRVAFPEILTGVYTRWDFDEAPRDFELVLLRDLPNPRT